MLRGKSGRDTPPSYEPTRTKRTGYAGRLLSQGPESAMAARWSRGIAAFASQWSIPEGTSGRGWRSCSASGSARKTILAAGGGSCEARCAVPARPQPARAGDPDDARRGPNHGSRARRGEVGQWFRWRVGECDEVGARAGTPRPSNRATHARGWEGNMWRVPRSVAGCRAREAGPGFELLLTALQRMSILKSCIRGPWRRLGRSVHRSRGIGRERGGCCSRRRCGAS
jgi:hypothetical protein